jgi:hypothetical protein
MSSQETGQLPKEIKAVNFLPGEFQPLIVAGKDIEKIIVGYSSKTAANDRSRKIGPRYFMRGGRPYYLVQDLIDHFTQNPVETFNDEGGHGNGNA